MKAVVFHGIGDIRLDTVRDPKLEKPTDALIRITASAICGTDLHFIRGTLSGMKAGTILGHEAVGIVEEVGKDVRNFRPGDRVVVPSTISCGYCAYCRAGYQAQCDVANPNGPRAGTAFYGGGEAGGSFAGLQAEYARIAFAPANLVKLPDEVDDGRAIMLSDIFPTAWFGAELAEITDGDTVVVFGCGPVGQFAILSAMLQGAGRILAVDRVPSRLEAAKRIGAEVHRAPDCELADRTAAEHADDVARLDLGDVGSHVTGRKDVREHDRLVVGDLVGQLHRPDVGERHPHELGLHPVERAGHLRPAVEGGAGLRPVGVGPVALRIVAGAAVRAGAAADRRGDHHAVAGPQVADPGADLLDHAHALVPEDRPRLHPRHGAAHEVQVGAADGAGGQAHDRVGRLADLRLGDVVEADVADVVEHHGLHEAPFRWRMLTSVVG